MKIKLLQVINARSIMEGLKGQEMSVKAAFNISLLLESSMSYLKFFQEKIKEFSELYGEKDEIGNLVGAEDGGIKIEEKYKKEAEEKIKELYELLVDIPDITLSLDELSDVKITVEDMHVLMPFITQNEKDDN